MNLARRLIRIQAALAIATGMALTLALFLEDPPVGALLLLGLGPVAFGVTLWPMSRLEQPADLRRLAFALILANFILSWGAVQPNALRIPASLGLSPAGRATLALLPVLLMIGFGRAVLQIGKLERAATEDLLYFPQSGIREPWLRQVSEAAAREERHRLARELHDSIKQQLFSIKLGAAAADARWESDPDGARAALGDVRRAAQAAMAEMQALLSQLRPVALSGSGLVEALREQCEALGFRTGARVDLQVGDIPGDPYFPASAREHLFRIAQEALSNIARHARATCVEVRLEPSGFEDTSTGPSTDMVAPLSLSGIPTANPTRRPTTLSLLVRDDGQGFDPGAARQGLGLRHIRERAQAVGGTADLDSRPGGGTELRVTLPLQNLEPRVEDPVEQAISASKWFGLAAGLLAVSALVGSYSTVLLLIGLSGAAGSYEQCYGRLTATLAPGPLRRLRHHGHLQRTFFFVTGGLWAFHLAQRGEANQQMLYGLGVLMGIGALAEAALFVAGYRRGEPSPPGAIPLLATILAILVGGGLLLLLGLPLAGVIRGSIVATCLVYLGRWWFEWRGEGHKGPQGLQGR